MWTALKSRVEAIAANDENNSDVNNDDSDSDNNTCRVEDTVQENKTLRVELFAAYNRLQDTQDNLIKAEALISLSDAEKNAKLHVAEEECAYQRALSAEHMKRAEELSQIVRNYERHNIKVNMELIERNALKKEAEQLRKTNKEVRADITAKNRTIHALQKEKREQAAALVELQQSAASTSQTYQSTVKNNEDLARVNIELEGQLTATKARSVLMQSDYSRAVTQTHCLEVQLLSSSAEVRHLEQKCLSLSREVLRLSNIEDVYKSSHDIVLRSPSLSDDGDTTATNTPDTSANTTPAASEHGTSHECPGKGGYNTDLSENSRRRTGHRDHEYGCDHRRRPLGEEEYEYDDGSDAFIYGQTEDCMCIDLGSIFSSRSLAVEKKKKQQQQQKQLAISSSSSSISTKQTNAKRRSTSSS